MLKEYTGHASYFGRRCGTPLGRFVLVRKVRTTRLSNHTVGSQQDVSLGRLEILDTLQHGCHGHGTNICAILVLAGQRDG
jgi:hypothetical protein